MVKLYLSDSKETLLVKISGDNFYELIEVLKEFRFQFREEYEGRTSVWVKNAIETKPALEKLLRVETFSISEEVFDRVEAKPETERFRVSFNEDLLMSPPVGEYQVEAIKRGIKQSRLYLAHKMGLGKTFIIISILNHLWEAKLIDKILIVAPPASVYNFRRELLKFNSFNLQPEEIYVANAKRRDPFQDNIKIVIMTYRTFLMLSDTAYKKKMGRSSKKYRTACLPIGDWGTERAIILDEAHMIKNRQARQTVALQLHKHYFKFRYLLSGTPYPRGIEDLYSQIKFLDGNLITEDYYDWLKTVAYLGDKWSEWGIASYNKRGVREFLERIDPWIIREFAEDNLNLPSHIKRQVYTEISDTQREIYRYYIRTFLEKSKAESGIIKVKEIYLNFSRISLALENPCILKGKIDPLGDPEFYKLVEHWNFKDHSKLEVLTSLLEKYVNEEGKKTIIWSSHPLTIKQLGEYYKKYNPIIIHGEMEIPLGVSKEEYRDSLVEKFKKDKKHKILIASSLMLARAVNLVEAPRAICFDRGWNFEIWEQLSKRNHRIGSTETVVLDSIILENTLEERLDRVLEKREDIDKNLLKYNSLSKEQWERLFEGHEI